MTETLLNNGVTVQSSEALRHNEAAPGSAMPIAIVGISCRLAGAATSPEGLWHMLSKGLSGWSQGASSRFKMDSFYHPATEMSGAFVTKGLYLLKQDVSHFDNQFFNISPVEAKAIDPQQRLMLELAYEAFENAGITVESLSSSETGVYCAVSNHDYETMQGRDPELSPVYRFTGTGVALAANRISYFFNLRGPSITLDTACSGSLVAVHEACKAIRSGEIRQALVGGTNLILDPERISVMSSLQVLSSHGRCYTFDSRANGFGRGEGVAAVVLKPLSDALRDNDSIHAVIRGTAVNSDGRTPGVTMPSQEAQVRMMRKAYAEAGLDPRKTIYVEAHGTGTQVGDKIESAAIAETFTPERSEESVLYVGSVKTNIGHVESTAGLAGLLKAVLVLKHGKIPQNLNFSHANDEIHLKEWKLKVPQKLLDWPENEVRRASINSFGYGGTNAHVILESSGDYRALESHLSEHKEASSGMSSRPDSYSTTSSSPNGGSSGDWAEIDANGDLCARKRDDMNPQKRHAFVLTHNNEGGIGKLAGDLKKYLQQNSQDDSNISDNLAYTLSQRRSRLPFRVAVSATSTEELLECLDNVTKGLVRPQKALEQPRICFAFTGQGAQWACMARELLNNYPVFANSMASSESYLLSLGADWTLLAELSKITAESRINEAAISQPCCTAVQLGLVDLLQSWGVQPQSVCGHSSGEIAAAYAAGFLSASDALQIAFHRGECVANLKTKNPELEGRMLAAGISAEKAQEYILKASSKSSGKVVVACINSPMSVTLSGDKSAIQSIQSDLEGDGVFNRILQVDVAYHSHHMELIREEYLRTMEGLRPLKSESGVRMISSVTGKEVHGESVTADYWARNMVSAVQFSKALEGCLTLLPEHTKSSYPTADLILEIGPHSALAGPIKQTLKASRQDFSKVSYHSVLLRNEDSVKSAMDTVGGLFVRGVDVSFDAVNDPCHTSEKTALTNLPSYNWQHESSHWTEGRVSSQYRLRQFPRHDLLGVLSHDSLSTEPTWRNYIRVSELPWMEGHVVNEQIIFPASGYICMALEALRQTTVTSGQAWKNMLCRFRQIVIERALLVPDNTAGVEVFFSLRRFTTSARELSSDWKEFRVFSVSEKGEAAEHCRGLVCVERRGDNGDVEGPRESHHLASIASEGFEKARKMCRDPIDPKELYSSLKSIGISYTCPFANLTEIRTGPLQSSCCITIPETMQSMPGGYQQPHIMHPATLDTCFQTAFPALMSTKKMTSSFVLSSIDELDISGDISSKPATILLAHATVEPYGRQKQRAEVNIADSKLTDPSLISIKGLGFTSTGAISSSDQDEGANLCHRVEWNMDTATADNEAIYRLCHAGLQEASAFEQRAIYDLFIETMIQKVLSVISPADEASMAPHHKSLVQWMRARKPELPVTADPTLREKVKAFGIDGVMLVHVSDHLVEILRGEVDPLTVLMKDDLLYRVYSTENTHRCHFQLANYIRQLQIKNPQMRILEIGAGTASTTIPVLEALTEEWPEHARQIAKLDKYVFTDISSGFFEKAKVRLERWGSVVEFKKLDVEKPVDEQGFTPGTFDLILASNVLHATQSLSNTLKNVRNLLKPGGKLALVEITEPHMIWPMIVGSLPGWWLGAADGRIDSPLLDLPGWNKVLSRTGFSGVDSGLKDYEPAYEHQVSLMISTATSAVEATSLPPIHVVCNQEEQSIATAFSELVNVDKQHEFQQTSLGEVDPSEKIYVVLLDIFAPFLASCSQDDFQNIKNIFKEAKSILWVTRGAAVEACNPEKALITGLSRTLRSEDHSLKIVTLDLDPTKGDPIDMAQHIHTVFNQAFGPGSAGTYLTEFEYAVRDGVVLIPRIIEDSPLEAFVQCSMGEQQPQLANLTQPDRSFGLEIETPGLLETLYWTDSPIHSRKPSADEVRIEVTMVALNFKDLMNAMGQLEGLSAMLIECGGTVVEVGKNASHRFRIGDRVCAIGYDGLATISNVDHHLVQHVPDGMSLEVATAVQVSYTTALYALRDVARLQKGESILIHSGAGALGQAAITLAKYLGAGKIFVTVGNAEKKSLVMKNFGIPEENIFSSRALSFGPGIRRQTNGQGVDVVLNSLSGEAARESQRCLNKFGRFLELGKKDLLSNARMEMQFLEKNSIFAAVDLTMVAQHKPSNIQELLGTVLDLVHTKKVQLLHPISVEPVSKLEDRFRLMQGGKHTGKLIVQIDPQSKVKIQPRTPPPPQLNPDNTYLVVGGLGGLGRAIIRFLATLGAKHIATLSRSGIEGGSKEVFVKEMRDAGLDLIVQRGSVASIDDIRKLKEATQPWPIRGVIQGAMVLQDATVNNMTYAQWQTSLGPKVTGTLNLHSILGDSLDFFILLSSGCGIVGSHGQGNYSAGSTFQDAFARYRTSLGLPVRTIDLGIVGSEGYTAENKSAAAHAKRQGVNFLRLEELLALVNHAIVNPISKDVAGAQILVGTRRADPASNTDEAAAQRPDPRFSHVWITRSRQESSKSGSAELDFRAALRTTETQNAAVETVQVSLVDKLSRLLAMPVEDIRSDQSVSSYGADSLIAVELRNWVAKQLEAHLQIFELMSALPIHGLAKLVAERSRLVPALVFASKE